MVINEETTGEFKAVPGKVPVYFTPKSLGAFAGVLAIVWAAITFVLALMFYPRNDGEKLRTDFDHHVVTIREHVDKVQDEKLEKLNELIEQDRESDRRMELKMERLAPKHRRDALPASLRAPMPDRGDGHE